MFLMQWLTSCRTRRKSSRSRKWTSKATRPAAVADVDPDKPLRALAFKIMDDRYGALTFTRIYSGTLKKGDNVLNTFTGKTERIGRIVEMHADSREELDSAQAGDIVALLGMKNTRTGHTLADPNNPATLEPMVFPDPVISIAIAPKDKAGTEKMGVALNKMVQEDPSFQVATDEDSGETLIKGMGELHLDIKVDILKRTHGVEVEMGKPQVAYRETITQTIEDSYTHKKQSGGSGQYGKIDYMIEPAERERWLRVRIAGDGRQRTARVLGRDRKSVPGQHGRRHAGRLSAAGRQVHAA